MENKKRSKTDHKNKKKEIRRNRIFLVFFVFSVVFLVTNLVSLGSERKREDKFINLIGTAENYSKEDNNSTDNININKDTENLVKYDIATEKEGWLANITKVVPNNPNAQLIIDNHENLPEDLFKMAGTNPDTIDFVAKYIDNTIRFKFKYPSRIFKDVKANYYIQWDQKWGFQEYGTGIIGNAGCAPTSLAMMLSGITGKNITPDEIATLATENGHVGDYGTNWDLYPFIADEFNLSVKTLMNDENAIKKELDNGNFVLVSVGPGTFTTISHVMLMVGYDENGYFKIYDPNNLQNSQKTWDYNIFSKEIKNIHTI